MDGGAEWVAIGVSLVVGVAGLVFAFFADRRAKESAQLAERANEIAADAVGKAREANKIAENANTLSEEANSIARAQAAQQADPSHVEWRAEWDPKASIARLTNQGRDVAMNVTVLVNPKGVGDLVRFDRHVARGEQLIVPFPEVAEQREKHRQEAGRRAQLGRSLGSDVTVFWGPFGRTVELDVRWASELGNAGQQTVKFYLS